MTIGIPINSRIDIKSEDSDEELRFLAKNHPHNGEYTTTICRGCGCIYTAPEGYWKNASIVDRCISCIQMEER